MHDLVYKICDAALWRAAEASGTFDGAPIDLADGYIHFSTAAQLRETARRHFAGQGGLVLAAIDTKSLGAALRYEPARDGQLFPHLHAPLPMRSVRWCVTLPLGNDGTHLFPDEID